MTLKKKGDADSVERIIKIEDVANNSETLRISADSSNFKYIRQSNYLYVDKTQQIFENLLMNGKYFFICRPRRFGKSMLCSTIDELFSGNNDLFDGLWIDGKWDFEANKCPVIHLDMSTVSSSESDSEFHSKLHNKLNAVAKRNQVTLVSTMSADSKLEAIIEELALKSGKQVVVVIDEYDAPVLALRDNQEKSVQATLKSFYGILKSCDHNLRLVYMTGSMNLPLFSELININDISFDLSAGSLCGYTEAEFKNYFSPLFQKLKKECNISNY